MKVFNVIAKVLVALAAVAGVAYVVATYGDKIVAWAKKLLGKCGSCTEETCEPAEEPAAEEVAEETVEETAEELPDDPEVEVEVVVAENEPVAEDADFEA